MFRVLARYKILGRNQVDFSSGTIEEYSEDRLFGINGLDESVHVVGEYVFWSFFKYGPCKCSSSTKQNTELRFLGKNTGLLQPTSRGNWFKSIRFSCTPN